MYNALYGQGNCVDGLKKECYSDGGHAHNAACSAADNYCAINVEELLDIVANRDELVTPPNAAMQLLLIQVQI